MATCDTSPTQGRSSSKRSSMLRTPSPNARLTRRPFAPVHAQQDVSATGFDSLGLKEFLETDPRPAFVLDLSANPEDNTPLSKIVYANSPMALSKCQQGLVNLNDEMSCPGAAVSRFWAWTQDRTGSAIGTDFEACSFAGMGWVRTTLRSRWRIISACNSLRDEGYSDQQVFSCRKQETAGTGTADKNKHDGAIETKTASSPAIVAPSSPPPELQRNSMQSSSRDKLGSYDWTATEPPLEMSPHVKFARSFDWSKTSLGAMETWSDGFRMACNFLMSDPRPAAVMWGSDRNILYNAPYIEIAGKRHPDKFGAPFNEAYPEVAGFSDYFTVIERSGQGFTKEDSEFFLNRHGFVEETYFSYTLTPLWDHNRVGGFYNPVFETTRRQIAERRMGTLIKLGESTAANRSSKQFWRQAIHALQLNEHDFPFASVYSVSSQEDMSDSSSSCSESSFNSSSAYKRLFLEGSVGVPEGHPAAIPDLDLSHGQHGFLPHFRAAARSGEVVALHSGNGSLSESLLQGITCRPFGDPCRSIVILPIKPTVGTDNIGGFVLLGLNPRRPYDEDYHVFFQLFSRLLGASMAAALLIEEEVRKSRTAAKRAALDQAKLEEELARSAQQAKRLEMQFVHFAERAPIGINMFNAEGKILYANDVWYDVTMYDRSDDTPMSWINCFEMEDTANVQDIWKKLLVEKLSVTFECRLKKPWRPPGSVKAADGTNFTWVLASAYPEVNPSDGNVDVIVGCFMNISQHKWAEELQKRRMNEAIEAKTLQERFIDMTSHEMRNPLSAIIHCCDGIISALGTHGSSPNEDYEISHEAIANSLDAARTILHCSVHQKRIVDDILTLSKLDSDLLPVSPVNVHILNTVKDALSMFNAEVKSADIKLLFDVDESFEKLELSWVYVDPSRLTQVFINLLTNAIKFTQTEARRIIKVRLGASLDRPTSTAPGIKYVTSKEPERSDITSGSDWGNEQAVFLSFSVEDTGRGLTQPEIDLLFRRFSQASPRTHVQYGGSGLGLYIARELTEKLGGEIGVASKAGKGSTFAFYVKSRRAPPLDTYNTLLGLTRSKSATKSELAVVLERKLSVPSAAGTLNSLGPPPPRLSKVKSKPAVNTRFPILIVEDNLVNRKVLKKQLSNLGFPIHEANHGEEALAFLRETKFWSGKEKDGKDLALVLMDLEMPVMDGLTCMRKIRALQIDGTVTAHVPTIAVTANARKEQIDTALAAGMDNVVCKPFRIPELVAQMEALELEWRSHEA